MGGAVRPSRMHRAIAPLSPVAMLAMLRAVSCAIAARQDRRASRSPVARSLRGLVPQRMPGISHVPPDPPPRRGGRREAVRPGTRGAARGSSANTPLRVMIVDDEELFRSGLRGMLEVDGLEVVGEARRVEDALEIVARSAPDVVLLSLDNNSGMPATEATRRLAGVAPGARVVAVADGRDPHAVVDALVAGATGYLAKEESGAARAAETVRAAAAGETVLSGGTARVAVERLRRLSAARAAADAFVAALSQREVEVLRLLVEGKDNVEIGLALFI